jgi:hypothetical protein
MMNKLDSSHSVADGEVDGLVRFIRRTTVSR